MSVPIKNIAGSHIKRVRLDKGITQDQLSAKLARQSVQIDRAGISKIETGVRCVYDFELKALASALSSTPAQLLGE